MKHIFLSLLVLPAFGAMAQHEINCTLNTSTTYIAGIEGGGSTTTGTIQLIFSDDVRVTSFVSDTSAIASKMKFEKGDTLTISFSHYEGGFRFGDENGKARVVPEPAPVFESNGHQKQIKNLDCDSVTYLFKGARYVYKFPDRVTNVIAMP